MTKKTKNTTQPTPEEPELEVAESAEPRRMPGEKVSVGLGERKGILTEMGADSEMPVLIVEQLEDAKKLAQKTGQRVRKRFNKREFVKQFPQAGSDPRMAFTPDTFVLDVTPMATLTVGELRDMCLKAGGGHPLAFQKACQVEGLEDSRVIHILKEEFMILRRAAS